MNQIQNFIKSVRPAHPDAAWNMQRRIKAEPVRALWWKQPYGTLMLDGKVETRTWDTNYRGLVLICTSKTPYGMTAIRRISDPVELVTAGVFENIYDQRLQFPFNICGHAIAIGELTSTRPLSTSDKSFVRYDENLFGHFYSHVHAIHPILMRGKQGWKRLTSDEKGSIKIITE